MYGMCNKLQMPRKIFSALFFKRALKHTKYLLVLVFPFTIWQNKKELAGLFKKCSGYNLKPYFFNQFSTFLFFTDQVYERVFFSERTHIISLSWLVIVNRDRAVCGQWSAMLNES